MVNLQPCCSDISAQRSIKASASLSPSDAAGLQSLAEAAGKRFVRGRRPQSKPTTHVSRNRHLGVLRCRKCAASGMLEHGTNLVQCRPRKPVDELVDRDTILQVLEQRGHRNARGFEQPCAAYALRVALHCRAGRPVDHVFMVAPLPGLQAAHRRPDAVVVRANETLERQQLMRQHGRRARAVGGCGQGARQGLPVGDLLFQDLDLKQQYRRRAGSCLFLRPRACRCRASGTAAQSVGRNATAN